MGAMRAGLALLLGAGLQLRVPIPILCRMCVVRDRRVSVTPLLAVIACMSPHPIAISTSRPEAVARLEVWNDRFDDVVIYVIRNRTPIELGVAPAPSHRTFALSNATLGSGGAIALGIGQRGGLLQQTTAPFDLFPGRVASWTIRGGPRVEHPVVN